MGLGSGERGAKRICMSMFEDAFSRQEQVMDYVENFDRSKIVTVRDGNVMLMGLPRSVQTLEEITSYVENSISKALTHTRILIITFDNPVHVPNAKSATQVKRDTSSADTKNEKFVDSFLHTYQEGCSMEEIAMLPNCQTFIKCRKTRYMMFDAIMSNVVERIMSWNVEDDVNGMALLIEGIDLRGASRLLGAESIHRERVSSYAVINNAVFESMAFNVPLIVQNTGEADLKLRNYVEALSMHPDKLDMILVETIDTDILPIMLLDICRDDDLLTQLLHSCDSPVSTQLTLPSFFGEPTDTNDPLTSTPSTTIEEAMDYIPENMLMGDAYNDLEGVAPDNMVDANAARPKVVVVMKERGSYACDELQRVLEERGRTPKWSSNAGWLMIDTQVLASQLLQTAPGVKDATQARVFFHLIAYGWALDGCDFVNPPYSDVEPFMAIVASLFRTPMGSRQQKLQSITNNCPSEETMNMLFKLSSCAYSTRSMTQERVRRAVWTNLYWRSKGDQWPSPESYTF